MTKFTNTVNNIPYVIHRPVPKIYYVDNTPTDQIGVTNYKRVSRFRNYIPKVDQPESETTLPYTKWECQTMIGNLRLVESAAPEKKKWSLFGKSA